MAVALQHPSDIGSVSDTEKVEGIRHRVRLALWHTQTQRYQAERRREKRHPFPYPIRLTPLAPDGTICEEEAIVVLGKHLSEQGLDFYTQQSVPYRWVLATFDCGSHGSVSIVIELTWCRFGHHGLYENGGRFIESARSVDR